MLNINVLYKRDHIKSNRHELWVNKHEIQLNSKSDFTKDATAKWLIYSRKTVLHETTVNFFTDECVSYCWQTVKIDFHVHPGTLVVAQDENHCKLLCSNTSTCRGVDWKSDNSSCWLINSSEKFREKLTGLRHWDIIRNLSTPCQSRYCHT